MTETVPTGYHADGDTTKTVTVDTAATCVDDPYDGNHVEFLNIPLTDFSVSVDSQVVGGTDTDVTCKDASNTTVASGSTNNTTGDGDPVASASNLEPGMYTCTIVIDP